VFRLSSHSSLHTPTLILVIFSLPTVRPQEFHFRRLPLVSLPHYSFIHVYSYIMQRQNRFGYSCTTLPPCLREVRSVFSCTYAALYCYHHGFCMLHANVIQNVQFIMSPNTEALLHRKPALNERPVTAAVLQKACRIIPSLVNITDIRTEYV
jgi:hypothetical protein